MKTNAIIHLNHNLINTGRNQGTFLRVRSWSRTIER